MGQRLCSVSASIRAGPPQVSDNGVSLDRTADTEQYDDISLLRPELHPSNGTLTKKVSDVLLQAITG